MSKVKILYYDSPLLGLTLKTKNYPLQGSHQSGKSGKNLTIFSSQGKQGFSGTIREKVCQSGNFFQPAKIVFANHVSLAWEGLGFQDSSPCQGQASHAFNLPSWRC